MIKEAFRQQPLLKEAISQSIRELGKYYSRLELLTLRMRRRSDELLRTCKLSIKNGRKERAIIYANEIAEIRKFLTTVSRTQIALEQAILRLETIREVYPTLEELKSLISDVGGVLSSVAEIMPSAYPEFTKLKNVVNSILESTQISATPPMEPVVTSGPSAKAIIEEATYLLEEDVKRKIPEPPRSLPPEIITDPPTPPIKEKIAITSTGSEVSIPSEVANLRQGKKRSGEPSYSSNDEYTPLLMELILDYLERNNGELDLDECSKELNMSKERVLELLERLSVEGKIKIEQ